MKVIVSTKLEDIYDNFVLTDSLKKVREMPGVTTLILNDCVEGEFDIGVFISEFHKSGIGQFIYINENPSTTVKMVIKGVNGYYVEDEFYLQDEEELMSLLEELGLDENSDNYSLASSNIKVVSDFIQAFARGEDKIKAPLYLEQVSSAVNELVEINHNQELQITAMGTSALEVFEKASSIIKTLDTQRRTIEKQLQELEDSQNSTPSRVNLSNSLMFWQPYRYVGNTKILLIRELSACRYLTSFTLGYLHHLHYEMNKRVKLVICRQKAQGLALRYNHEMFTFINSDNANMSSLYDSEIIVTDSPKKEIMKDLLSKPCDLIIVLDRLFGNMDIVSGKITAKVNAISGRGDLQRFHVKAEDCIFSVTGVKNSFCNLFTIKDFPDEVDARYAYYNQTFAESYKKFDKKVGIIK